jgi:hypothetical protein
MTGNQGLALLIGAPILAVVVALLVRARPLFVAIAAVGAEVVAYLFMVWWGGQSLRRLSHQHEPVLVGYAQTDWRARLVPLLLLGLFALIVAGLGLLVARGVRRGRA